MKKVLIFLLVIGVSGYLYAGHYVYNQAGSVPCAVWEGEQNNSPSEFTIWSEEYDIDPTPYFIPTYETVEIPVPNEEIILSAWWMETQKEGPTILLIHGLTSSKYSSGILLAAGILYHEGFNVLALSLIHI